MKKFFLLFIFIANSVQAANLYKRPFKIEEPGVSITIPSIINQDYFKQVVKQLNSLPEGIPKIVEVLIDNGEPLEDGFQAKFAKSKDLIERTEQTGIQHVYVAYNNGETYSLGNSVGRVFATNTGLILLNDLRLKEITGVDTNQVYLVNVILHELLHIYGLDHASGLYNLVKNTPVMNLGKFGRLGMSHDDIAGLRENYNINPGKRRSVTINAPGGNIGLVGKRSRAQGKEIRGGTATFPQLKRGRYKVYWNNQLIGRIRTRCHNLILDVVEGTLVRRGCL